MAADLDWIFARLKAALNQSAPGLTVSADSPGRFELGATPGPATLAAWRGKMKRAHIPVAWVALGKDHVSYHLMPLDHPAIRKTLSQPLQARLQGKTCFTFRTHEEPLFRELEEVTARGLAEFRKAGFVAERESA